MSHYQKDQAEALRNANEIQVELADIIKKHNRITKARKLVSMAKNELINRNLRLVVNVAKNYVGRGLSLLVPQC